VPQTPQLSVSVCVFTQLVPHVMLPAGHAEMHTAAEQYGVAVGHATPHAPQFEPSVAKLVQVVPHAVLSAAQPQTPLLQT
jgi:hypothetical protein